MTSPATLDLSSSGHCIRSVEVIGGFLDGVRMDFDGGLNCIIGARGTGKTTILELIRFALDALPGQDDEDGERRRIEGLIKQNLSGGRVQVTFQTRNGLTYVANRSWGDDPVVTTADGQPTQITLRAGGVFQAEIFSQNEVERIAERSTSQLALIDRFRRESVAEVGAKLRELRRDLRANAEHLVALEAQHAEVTEEVATLPDIEEQLKGFAGSGGEDAEVVDRAHGHKALRDDELLAVESIDREITNSEHAIRSQKGSVNEQLSFLFSDAMLAGPNGVTLTELADQLFAFFAITDTLLESAAEQLSEAQRQVDAHREKLATAHDQQELAYRAVIEMREAVMEQATERARLQRVRGDLLTKKRLRDEIQTKLTAAWNKRVELLSLLSELRDRRFAIRQDVTERINRAISPKIQVRLEQFGDVEAYRRLLGDALKSSSIQQNVVAGKIAQTVPPRELAELVRQGDAVSIMKLSGINDAQAAKVIDALKQHDVLFGLEIVDMNDRPRISLLDGDKYKDSLTLSTGQKCTSILPILLLDSDRPLLVDQPEDNLDNGFIYETVVSRLRDVKSARQLILVTHNPNIPVLGDAGRVFVLKSNGSKAWIESEGTVENCRLHIVNLLEGGEEAFKLRKEKYNY